MASEWREATWGDLGTLEYGRGLRGYEGAAGAYRVFGTNGPIGWHTEPLCAHPTVIVGRKGAYRGIHYSNRPCFVIDTAFYLEPRKGVEPRWAYYCLLTYDINGMDSGSAIPSTSRDAFYNLPVLVPPPEEQRAIAEILGTLDDKIELSRRMNETLEAMARALFKSWFVDFEPVRAKMDGRWKRGQSLPGLPAHLYDLFPSRLVDSDLGEIPEGWIIDRMGAHFRITMGQSPPGTTYNEQGVGLPFYQGRVDFGFRFPARRVFCSVQTRVAEKGDTLVTVRAPVGDVNLARERCAIGRGVAAVRHVNGSRSFSYYFARSLKPAFDRFEAGGTVFGAINKDEFNSIETAIAPRQIVAGFDQLCAAFDDRIENNERESDTLAGLRDALLPKLISGEIRVKKQSRAFGVF